MKKTGIFGTMMVILILSVFLSACSNQESNGNVILPSESYEEKIGESTENNIGIGTDPKYYLEYFETNITQNKKFPSVDDEVVVSIEVSYLGTNLEENVDYALQAYKETDKSIIFKGDTTSDSNTNLTFTFIPKTSGTYIFEIFASDEKIGNKSIIILKNTYKEYTGPVYELPDINCTDYDGKDYYKRTACFDKYNPNGISDYCIDSDWVVDYGCSKDGSDMCIERKYECPNGCLHGACLRID